METDRRKRSSSGEIFSFPSTPNQDLDSEFEFGCFTPDSPSQDPCRTSPADHLFFNGRLLPHAFPLQPGTTIAGSCSRGTSRTSSINSKDSLMSSRSNSTNSRSSCSSARTSSSDNSERRLLYHHSKIHACNKASKMVTAQLYGDSQRWQYITQVPVLKREVSRRKNSGVEGKEALRAKKQGEHHQKSSSSRGRSGPCLKFFRLFLFACRVCHAMEPSRKQDVMHGNLRNAV
ncbi:uncharacterized protein LOC108481653 [Gossypium arboreum]|uniref:uncharacterized protein LOC108481653 n=1 Tax=Gossypium arboreum TaxID=29729 RepID=UPI00081964C0|nr:uncharacterized protein LOC108481653 [Gossypium arboreum]